MLLKSDYYQSATLCWPIGRNMAGFIFHPDNRSFQFGRIVRKVAEMWPFPGNRQAHHRELLKSAFPIVEFIAEKIK